MKKKIDKAIAMSRIYDEFKNRLLDIDGIVINDIGKHISFKAPTMERVRRGKTIGENYTKEAIIKRIESGAEYGKNITYADTIELHTRRTTRENTQKITDALSVIRQEKIKDYDDMQSRLNEINKTAAELKVKIDELNTKVTHYKKIAGYLETYNKYSDIYEEYKNLKGKKQKLYQCEHGQELEAYEYAKVMIENHNVNPDIDLDKVFELIREKNDIIINLTSDYAKIKKRVKKLAEAGRTINKVAVGRDRNRIINKQTK